MKLSLQNVRGIMHTTIEVPTQKLAELILEAARKEFGGSLPEDGNIYATSDVFDCNVLTIQVAKPNQGE